ncbi:MAG TPA: hypothetical protein ENN32_07630, partial [Chloroflexi bacterium]|nr:hypothetical protein [Chloroflexota bacterium]
DVGGAVSKVQGAFNEVEKPVKGSRILVLGVAYISDMRESLAAALPATPSGGRAGDLGRHR